MPNNKRILKLSCKCRSEYQAIPDDGWFSADNLQCGQCHQMILREEAVSILSRHAYSLSEMVKWFKKMIEQGNMPEAPGRSDELTVGYCDELLEDLKDES